MLEGRRHLDSAGASNPLRAAPNGFPFHPLSRSDTLSCLPGSSPLQSQATRAPLLRRRARESPVGRWWRCRSAAGRCRTRWSAATARGHPSPQQDHLVRAALKRLTAVGFEPTPLRNGALRHRLRPLGQTVLSRAIERFVWLLDLKTCQSAPILSEPPEVENHALWGAFGPCPSKTSPHVCGCDAHALPAGPGGR